MGLYCIIQVQNIGKTANVTLSKAKTMWSKSTSNLNNTAQRQLSFVCEYTRHRCVACMKIRKSKCKSHRGSQSLSGLYLLEEMAASHQDDFIHHKITFSLCTCNYCSFFISYHCPGQSPIVGIGMILIGVETLTHRPVVIDMFGNVCSWVIGWEEELFRLPTDQNKPQVYLQHR